MADWHIDGRDVFIQDWETDNEMAVDEAEIKLNRLAQLEPLIVCQLYDG